MTMQAQQLQQRQRRQPIFVPPALCRNSDAAADK